VTQKPQEAMKYYQEGLGLAQQIESETTSVETMIGMGLASQKTGVPDDTIEYLEAALDFASGPKGEAAGLIRRYLPAIYISLGDAYYQKHELERAEGYLRDALKLDRRQRLTPDIRYSIYGTFAEIHLERGEMAKARRIMPTLKAIANVFPPARGHCAKLAERTRR
jgi:tetratricopeptide (TPR) repeat protein